MNAKARLRRLIRLAGIADAKGQMIPLFESRAVMRAVIAFGDKVIAARTHRRYRRSDNKKAVLEGC